MGPFLKRTKTKGLVTPRVPSCTLETNPQKGTVSLLSHGSSSDPAVPLTLLKTESSPTFHRGSLSLSLLLSLSLPVPTSVSVTDLPLLRLPFPWTHSQTGLVLPGLLSLYVLLRDWAPGVPAPRTPLMPYEGLVFVGRVPHVDRDWRAEKGIRTRCVFPCKGTKDPHPRPVHFAVLQTLPSSKSPRPGRG